MDECKIIFMTRQIVDSKYSHQNYEVPLFVNLTFLDAHADTNRIYDGVEAETRKSQASFQII